MKVFSDTPLFWSHVKFALLFLMIGSALLGCFSPGTATYVVSVAPELEMTRDGPLNQFKLTRPDVEISFEILSRARLKSACAELMVAVPVGVHVGGIKTFNYPMIVLNVVPRKPGATFDPTRLVLVYKGREFEPVSVKAYPDDRLVNAPETLSAARSYRVEFPFELDARESFQFRVDGQIVSFVPHETQIRTQTGEAGCQE